MKIISFLIFLLVLAVVNVYAQLPQHYNYNTGGTSNSIPFNNSQMRCQWLIAPGELNQPFPAPSGYITKLWLRVGSSPSGYGIYTNLKIELAQDTITALPGGQYHTGQHQTVYFRSSDTVQSLPNTFVGFVLDTAFFYNPSLSLIIDITQCGMIGGFNVYHQLIYMPNRKGYGGAPCPPQYIQSAPTVPHCGINLTPVSGITGNTNVTPAEYLLKQNYPNPFNPSTIINFQLPITNFVKLAVYDISGKEVAVLVNDVKNAGTYSAKFDGSNLPSGVYIYKLEAGNYSEAMKMILIK